MAAYKRLSTGQRVQIQTMLDSRCSFKNIADELNVHPSTISREVKAHCVEHDTKGMGSYNRCSKRATCTKHDICPAHSYLCRNKKCASCRKVLCNNMCAEYDEYHCPKLDHPPYVCNGCEKRRVCAFRKKMYFADRADTASVTMRSESRSGMNLTEDEIQELDEILSPRIQLGQSIHHIFATSQNELYISEKTAYTLLHSGMISARPIDAPRIVRMSPRKSKPQVKVDKKCRIGRTYEDYLNYMIEHPDTGILEGDTVEGKKGGKCILTLTWKSTDFQVGFLRDHNTSASVTAIVDSLYETFGNELFHKVFPDVWVLDNGTEFSDPAAIEKYGIRVFYCDPSSPFQKGSCENTHEHIRRVLPKGTSFDELDQEFFDFLFSNINAITRKKLNDHSAYDVFSSLYSADMNIEKLLHIRFINPEKVELKPSLVKKFYQSHSAHTPL
ncbi:MAG: IS30 family transposase [Oscillospiraceae bacterium]|nr:IS30 family transposase [Oscillospiraceae bacterium]